MIKITASRKQLSQKLPKANLVPGSYYVQRGWNEV
jgi:hypothetical protein